MCIFESFYSLSSLTASLTGSVSQFLKVVLSETDDVIISPQISLNLIVVSYRSCRWNMLNVTLVGSQAFIQTFFLQPFFPKYSVSVALWGSPIVDTEIKFFEIYVCRSLENAFFFLIFFWNVIILWGILEEKLTRKIQTTFFYTCL